ncbi:Maf family protein [Reinekea marinisedimentorum]|uniref:7-methyl-GTP pyrophosphatase n=1 Tax=Reinekea marinisedimentorum TaxID=230495 RepID=A0A4R3I8H3_9GAMM|nr:Maf family protein [Reinekea marinisedimentorum]TCS42563.1 septum formation protein [Reinekea marinisedimentorum]
MKKPALILASTSTFKQKQLTQLCLNFDVFDPEIEEEHPESTPPETLAIELAASKAIAASATFAESWVIGSDQTAVTESGLLLTKPITEGKAFDQLSACQGQKARFYSAVCLINKSKNISRKWSVTTEVEFRQLSSEEIRRYIKKDEPLYCAGSFKIESLGISLFNAVRSEDPSALIGLPLISLSQELRSIGLLVP